MLSSIRTPRPGVLAASVAAVALVPALLAAPAHAAPPPNDDITGATQVTTTPATYTVDTTEATADPSDGRDVGDHSVWFTVTPDRDMRLPITSSGSSYDTRLTVFTGSRAHRSLVTSDRYRGVGRAARVTFRARAAHRYWIALSSDGAAQRGGTAYLSVGRDRELGYELTDLAATTGGVSGLLVLTADATCTRPGALSMEAVVSQLVGDHVAQASAEMWDQPCWPDRPVGIRLTFSNQTGWAFQPGTAVLSGHFYVWDGIAYSHQPPPILPVPVTETPLARTTGEGIAAPLARRAQ